MEEVKSARSTKQTTLTITNLKKIIFPLPPKETQKEIARHISGFKAQVQKFTEQAKYNRKKAIIELEKKIFNH